MYRRRGYRRRKRRREELKAYLQNLVVGVSIVCIIIVCVAVALRTRKATQIVEAKSAMMQAAEMETRKDMVKTPGEEIESEADMKNTFDTGLETDGKFATGEKADQNRKEVQSGQENGSSGVIVIDPGHGGVDGGCVFDNIVEKDVNRMIAAQVLMLLQDRGYQVELARKGDEYIDKTERVENANQQNALLYISIHQNSCEDHSVTGIETWYDGNDTSRDSGRLARLIQQETVRFTGAVSRELVSTSDLCVISKSIMPSCLIETGFLSNREERKKLASKEYRDQIAEGIVSGIMLYLNSESE